MNFLARFISRIYIIRAVVVSVKKRRAFSGFILWVILCWMSHREYLTYADRIQDYSYLETSYLVILAAVLLPLLLLYFTRGLPFQFKDNNGDSLEDTAPELFNKLMARDKLRSKGDFIIASKPNKSKKEEGSSKKNKKYS